jgi:hypothetical protein
MVRLGLDVKFEQMNLEDGTVIEAASFETGEAVFIVAEDGNIPLPVGDYTLEDGRMLSVAEEGIIATVGEAVAEESAEEEMEKESAPEYVTKADFEAAIEGIMAMFKEQPAPEAVEASAETEEIKVEASAEAEKVELSEEPMPAAKPIKPNPERQAEKQYQFKIASKGRVTTLDSVMSKIANINSK